MLANRLLHWLSVIYDPFISVGSNLQSLFLLYMRLTWGHQFFLYGLSGTMGWIELVGGFCLFIGFASRLVAVPLIVLMLGALGMDHTVAISEWQFLWEPLSLVRALPYPFLLTAVLVFVFGPGRISVDGWLKRWFLRQPRY